MCMPYRPSRRQGEGMSSLREDTGMSTLGAGAGMSDHCAQVLAAYCTPVLATIGVYRDSPPALNRTIDHQKTQQYE